MNLHTINRVALVTSKLFTGDTLVITFLELAEATGPYIDADDLFRDRHRLVEVLRTRYNILSHTVTDSIIADPNPTDPRYNHYYIPSGSRKVYGLRCVKNRRDPILQASRQNRDDHASRIYISTANTTLEIGSMNHWSAKTIRTLMEAMFERLATIEGDGTVTLAMRKMLSLREDLN